MNRTLAIITLVCIPFLTGATPVSCTTAQISATDQAITTAAAIGCQQVYANNPSKQGICLSLVQAGSTLAAAMGQAGAPAPSTVAPVAAPVAAKS